MTRACESLPDPYFVSNGMASRWHSLKALAKPVTKMAFVPASPAHPATWSRVEPRAIEPPRPSPWPLLHARPHACRPSAPCHGVPTMAARPHDTPARVETPPALRNAHAPRLTLLYDGECPLCLREVAMLRARSDKRGGTIAFVDISVDDFEEAGFGVSYEKAMGRIHGLDDRGRLIEGVEVFRLAYQAVGLGWVYGFTKIPGFLQLADFVYDLWAVRRLQWTGRDSLEVVVRAREERRTCR